MAKAKKVKRKAQSEDGETHASFDVDPELEEIDHRHDKSAIQFHRLRVSKEWHVVIPTATEDIREAVNEELIIRADNLDRELSLSANKIGSWAGPLVDLKAMLRDAKDDWDDVIDHYREHYRQFPKVERQKGNTVGEVDAWVHSEPEYKAARSKVRELERLVDFAEQALKAMNKRHEAVIELSQRKRRERGYESSARDSIEVPDDEPTPT